MNLQLKRLAFRTTAVVTSLVLFANCGPNNENAKYDIGEDEVVDSTNQPEGTEAETMGYRLMIKDDPSTSIVVGYSSDYSVPYDPYNTGDGEPKIRDTRIYFDAVDHGTNLNKYANVYKPTVTKIHKGKAHHFVEVKNLKPDTAYYFVVGDGKDNYSRRLWFKTAPSSDASRLSIISGGDTRTNRTPRQQGMKIVAKLRPHFVMFQGDHTTMNSNWEWERWLKDWQLTISADGRMIPALFTRGNHEQSNADLENIFHTPKGVYYAVTFGRDLLRVYTLNSESAVAGNQTKWLKDDLAANSHVRWKFAQYHSPIRPHTKGKSEETTQYNSWAPLFYSGRMNLVAEADAHTVKVTYPIRPSSSGERGFVRDDANGTVFVGEGCWGAPLRANDNISSWTRDSGRFNQFNWIFVDKTKTEIRTIMIGDPVNVSQLTDSTRFNIPSGLNIWKPSRGAVVTLSARR